MNTSTGPTTQEGKLRSSKNAYKHGLTGQLLLLTPEQKALYDEHCQGYFDLYKPVGSPEKALVQVIADDYWRSLCGRAFDCGRFLLAEAHEKSLANIALYITRIERSIKNNTQALRTMQEERKQAPLPADQEPKAAAKSVPVPVALSGQTPGQTPANPARTEFVFSSSQAPERPSQTEPLSQEDHMSATPQPAEKVLKAA